MRTTLAAINARAVRAKAFPRASYASGFGTGGPPPAHQLYAISFALHSARAKHVMPAANSKTLRHFMSEVPPSIVRPPRRRPSHLPARVASVQNLIDERVAVVVRGPRSSRTTFSERVVHALFVNPSDFSARRSALLALPAMITNSSRYSERPCRQRPVAGRVHTRFTRVGFQEAVTKTKHARPDR